MMFKKSLQKEKLIGINNNLYYKIIDINNISQAFMETLKKQKKIKRTRYLKHKDKIVNKIFELFINFSWTLKYNEAFYIREKGKVREIVSCSFLDKVAQKAIINQCENIFKRSMIDNTFQAIKGRGIHKANTKIKRYIKSFSKNGDVFFLHIDIRKYYASIDKDILKSVLQRKILCKNTMKLLEIIIDSNDFSNGILLGNLTSQWFGNMYLYDTDHYCSQFKNVKYLRYADDLIFISGDKNALKLAREKVLKMISDKNLSISKSVLGRITDKSALDTLGYKFYINRVAVRKHIKHKLSKAYHRNKRQSFMSLYGHCLWANSKKMLSNIIHTN